MDSAYDLLVKEKLLSVQDGVVLRSASVDYIFDLNKTGSLSLVKDVVTDGLSIKWKATQNILITDYVRSNETEKSDDEWAVVDTAYQDVAAPVASVAIDIDQLKAVKIMSDGQTIRLLRKSDGDCHSEYFFQNGSSEAFLNALKNVFAIDETQKNRRGFEFLYVDEDRLRTSFKELDLNEIKERKVQVSKWLPTNVVEFFAKIPNTLTPPCLLAEKASPLQEDFEVLQEEKPEPVSKSVKISLNIGKPVD